MAEKQKQNWRSTYFSWGSTMTCHQPTLSWKTSAGSTLPSWFFPDFTTFENHFWQGAISILKWVLPPLIVDWAANIEASTFATSETFQAARWDKVFQVTRCCQGLIILDVQRTLFTSINQYFQEALQTFEQSPCRSVTPSNCFQCFGDFSQPSTPRFQFRTIQHVEGNFPGGNLRQQVTRINIQGQRKFAKSSDLGKLFFFQRPGQLANEERGGSSGGVAPIWENASRHERQPISLARTLLSLELGSVSGSVTDSLSFKYAQSAHFLLPLILIRCCPLLQFP